MDVIATVKGGLNLSWDIQQAHMSDMVRCPQNLWPYNVDRDNRSNQTQRFPWLLFFHLMQPHLIGLEFHLDCSQCSYSCLWFSQEDPLR